MKKTTFIGLAAIVALVGAGCIKTSAPAPMNPASPAAPAEQLAAPLSEEEKADTEKMLEFMKDNPNPDSKLPSKPPVTDQKFNGALSRSGIFKKINYETSGAALIMERDKKAYVVFDEVFSTPNGPDLRVYLTKNSGPSTRTDIASGVLLAKLKSTKGKQVYEIPVGTSWQDFHSVTIHCSAFNVPWSYAAFK